MDIDTEDFEDEEGEIDEARLEVHLKDKLDDYIERYVNDVLADPVEYLEDIYGDEAIKKALEWGGIGYEKAADEAVNIDGPGHFLSGYDGEIRELPSGGVYWRTN